MEIKNFWFHDESTLNQLDAKVSRRILAYHEKLMIMRSHLKKTASGRCMSIPTNRLLMSWKVVSNLS